MNHSNKSCDCSEREIKMPDLTLTYTADQIIRMKTAFTPDDGVAATEDDLLDAMRAFLKTRVTIEEERIEQVAADATAKATLAAEGW